MISISPFSGWAKKKVFPDQPSSAGGPETTWIVGAGVRVAIGVDVGGRVIVGCGVVVHRATTTTVDLGGGGMVVRITLTGSGVAVTTMNCGAAAAATCVGAGRLIGGCPLPT